MATVQDLVEFIKSNPPQGEHWDASEWSDALDESVLGWRDIVKDPDNWPIIEKARPLSDFYALCYLFVECAGAGLANRWFKSSVPEQAKAVDMWLGKLIGWEWEMRHLSVQLWSSLSEEIRYELVLRVFYWSSREEPIWTLERIRDEIRELLRVEMIWRRNPEIPSWILEHLLRLASLPIPYIPPIQILRLRGIVKAAGDQKSLKLIDDMIAQRERAWERARWSISAVGLTNRILYTPTRFERELIALLMDKVQQGGFKVAALPEIFLSFETPPLFVAHPELDEGLEEEGVELGEHKEEREPSVPRRRERVRPDVISIEEVLGCYIPNPQIRLYAKGLHWCARELKLDEDMLRAVVLVHEVAHWISHLLPKPGVPEWPLDLYKRTEEEVHEGWAQLLTWWVVEEVGGAVKEVFEKLNRRQPQAYRVFERFKDKPVELIMSSLEKLRQLGRPAELKDWEQFVS